LQPQNETNASITEQQHSGSIISTLNINNNLQSDHTSNISPPNINSNLQSEQTSNISSIEQREVSQISHQNNNNNISHPSNETNTSTLQENRISLASPERIINNRYINFKIFT
jgi:hypothetical protein